MTADRRGTWVPVTAVAKQNRKQQVHNLTVGFSNTSDYNNFVDELNTGLSSAGYRQTQAAFQGSSVTGVSGRPVNFMIYGKN